MSQGVIRKSFEVILRPMSVRDMKYVVDFQKYQNKNVIIIIFTIPFNGIY